MDNTNELTNILLTNSANISILGLGTNIIMAAVLCVLLSLFYIRFGTTLSNRFHLAKIFVLLGVTTTLVITVVKASLALSLGLVGALSIVRFRTAVKEPEELAFIFLCIAIGLGLGSDNRVVTLVAFFLILGVYGIQKWAIFPRHEQENLILSINVSEVETLDFDKIVTLLAEHASKVSLKRFDKRSDGVDIVFQLLIKDIKSFETLRGFLESQTPPVSYSFVEDIRIT